MLDFDPSLIPGSNVEKFLEGIHFVSTDKKEIMPTRSELKLYPGRKYRFVFTASEEDANPVDTGADMLTAAPSDI